MNRAHAPRLLLLAIRPKREADRISLQQGLQQLTAEDPTLSVETDRQTGEVTIAALGELQLEIAIDRLRRDFLVEATVGRPQVAYTEALTRPADGDGRFARQAGGRGQYGHVRIHVSPGEPGTGYVFRNVLSGGAIPDHFVQPIQEGIRAACARGVLAGHPIQDVQIELYDGSYHDADSSDMAFAIAATIAFEDAARKARPVLLEPVMRVEVRVPEEHTRDVIGNLAARRGQIQSQDQRGDIQVIRALVPLSELFGYSTDLRSRTRGRATYSLQFDSYQKVHLDPGSSADDRHAPVGAPLRPVPGRRQSAVALPEPDDERPQV